MIVAEQVNRIGGQVACRTPQALGRGMALNIDNFQELERVDDWMARHPGCSSVIGIRVNPQVGGGRIAAMSTATDTSKFGIGLEDEGNRAAIVDAYRQRPWLTAIHAHVGSQGCPLDLIGQGIARTVALAQEINAAGQQRFDPRLPATFSLPTNGKASVFLGGRALPVGSQAPGSYSGTVTLVVSQLGS